MGVEAYDDLTRLLWRVSPPRAGAHRREAIATLTAEQLARCALCGDRPTWPRGLDLDHDHGTMLVRGLLCRSCNLTIDRQRKPVAVAYRAAPPARGRWVYFRHIHAPGFVAQPDGTGDVAAATAIVRTILLRSAA